MKIINYISSIAMPLIILIIIMYGVAEKNKVFSPDLIEALEEYIKGNR